VLLDETLALHEEAARTHGRVVDPSGEGLEHLDDQGDDRLGGVELPPPSSLRRERTGRGSIRRRGRGCPWPAARRA
jgi:hypothetical protein